MEELELKGKWEPFGKLFFFFMCKVGGYYAKRVFALFCFLIALMQSIKWTDKNTNSGFWKNSPL